MNKMYFECTALDSVVIRSRASTEGANGSLKYIPGNVFLGIVAKNYDDIEESFDIFHSGKVIFGDGHLAQSGYRSLKSPLNWFCNKDKKIQLEKESDKESDQLDKEKITIFDGNLDLENQQKQVRDIFFLPDGTTVECKEFYALKSAYNDQKRKSNDGQMYGYHALPCGTKWIFYVKGEDKYLKVIRRYLEEGKHSIGKSKSSQYGRVEIKCLEEYSESWETKKINNQVYIYAESLLAFVNKYGQPTYKPTAKDFGIDGNIDWERSQIRPYTYSPYNGARRSRDTDRICIDKGSVFVIEIENNSDFDFDNYCKEAQKGVGIYKNEGMGQILVNPTFLLGKNPTFSPQLQLSKLRHYQSSLEKYSSDEGTIKWLQQKTKQFDAKKNIAGKINDFIRDNASKFFISGEKENITPSQWGGIRSYAESSNNYEQLDKNLFEDNQPEQEKGGFLKRGKMENTWQKNDRVEILKNFIVTVEKTSAGNYYVVQEYLVELCSEMAKLSKVGG